MCELIDGFLALKLNENLAKLVGIILATAVALTGQIVPGYPVNLVIFSTPSSGPVSL